MILHFVRLDLLIGQPFILFSQFFPLFFIFVETRDKVVSTCILVLNVLTDPHNGVTAQCAHDTCPDYNGT